MLRSKCTESVYYSCHGKLCDPPQQEKRKGAWSFVEGFIYLAFFILAETFGENKK